MMRGQGIVLFLCVVLLTGCSERVTVVAIEETEACPGIKKMTTMDGYYGRFKRCGVWGNVGETFLFSRF